MTFVEVLNAVRRRWYCAVAVLVCALALYGTLARDAGIYTSSLRVFFSYPGTPPTRLYSGVENQGVVAFARTIATQASKGNPPSPYSSSDAPLYGAGLREAAYVGVQNDGNQWYTSYSRAIISINITGRSREWVETRQQAMSEEVLALADAQQESLGISPEHRMNVTVDRFSGSISYLAPSSSSLVASFLAMMSAALLCITFLCPFVDRTFSGARKKSN